MGSFKNILIVVDSIDINDSSGSKANVGIIKSLCHLGFNLKVYHYTRKNIDIPNVNCVSIPEKKENLKYFLSRGQRVFTRITKININPFIERLLGFSFTFFNDTDSIFDALAKENSFTPDLVITLSKGASFRPHYSLLKIKKWHSKWIAYIHDPYPFHHYPHPYNWTEPGYKRKELFFKKVSENAKHSAFPSLLLKNWMGVFYPQFLKSGIVIPHQHIPISIKNYTELPFFDKRKFNILHAGNLMKQRSPICLLEGFKLFLKNNPLAKVNSRLLLIGPSEYYTIALKKYENEIKELYLSKGNVAYQEVAYMQQHASVNVILESKSNISPFLPGKFPHCIIANKPILLLGPHESESRRLLGNDYPYFSEVDDATKIAEIIERLYQKWNLDSTQLTLNRNDLMEYISPSQLADVLNSLNQS